MAFTRLTLTSTRSLDVGASKGKAALRKVANLIQGSLGGANAVSGWLLENGNSTATLARSVAGVTMATGSGTVGSVINGTTVSAAWGTSDTVTAAALVTAINANTTVNPFVTATKYFGTVTLSTAVAGNTVGVCGYTFTGVAGTADYTKQQFSIDTSDTAAALDLSIAIQSCPGLNLKVGALSVAGVCYVFLLENRAARSDEILVAGASTVAVAAISTGAAYFIAARTPGLLGNCCTATATGTNMTARSAVAGKLGGGLGGYLSTSQYISSDTK